MDFDYLKPKDLSGALEILARGGKETRILAGGTDILVNIQEGLENPPTLVDINCLEELKGIEEKNGRIEIGSLVTHARIVDSPLLREKARPLTQACAEIGSPQIRSRGTIGGNLANASPSGDSIPALFVLGAVLTLRGPEGEREVPVEDFATGVKETVLGPDELLLKISFPVPAASGRGFFKKLGQRKALAIAKVSLAAWLEVERGKITSPRLALGAVATTVIRATETESYLEGKTLDEDIITSSARSIQKESRAISDIRSSADYRNEMTGLLLARGLEELAELKT